jgi:hypothetical protein
MQKIDLIVASLELGYVPEADTSEGDLTEYVCGCNQLVNCNRRVQWGCEHREEYI